MATATENVEQATQDAWAEYAEGLKGLEGTDYDRAEQAAWERLQATLNVLQAPSRLTDPPIG